MTLFHKDGHITKEGFQALIEEKADEMQRLELSEHLSFCEQCLNCYLEDLEKIPLLEVPPRYAQEVFQSAKQRAWPLWQKRFTMVAAACMATVLWTTGAFHTNVAMKERDFGRKISQHMYQITYQTDEITRNLSEQYMKFIERIDSRTSIQMEGKKNGKK